MFKETSPIDWSYCIIRTVASKNQNVLFYFHGRNGRAAWWNDKDYHTGKVHRSWVEMNLDPPIVVSISFGKMWLLTSKSPGHNEDLFKIFNSEVIPKVEAKVGHKIKKKMLMGISMGGMNSLLASTKGPKNFSKVAAICSPLTTLSHHSSWSELYEYFSSTSISIRKAAMKYYFSKTFFPTLKMWDDNNPLEIIKKIDPKILPKFYITCGEKDAWECMNGSKAMVSAIKKVVVPVEWYPRPGGHCDIEYKSLAKFLIH